MSHASSTVYPLRMKRNSTYTFRIQFENDGVPFNITGSFIRVSFRTINYSDPTNVPLFTKTTPTNVEILDQGTNLGQARVHIYPADTVGLPNQQLVLYYDADITIPEGTFSPLVTQRLIVDPEVTTP